MKDLFYKPVKIRHPDEDIFIWGCLHYDHLSEHWDTPLWKMRGFDSLEEHNEALLSNWNSVTSETSVGFLLGDTMFGNGGADKFRSILRELNFSVLYIMSGNHMAGFKKFFEDLNDNVWDEGNKKVVVCPNYLEVLINGKSVVMSHYPLASWNGQSKASFHLHSHTHGNLEKSDLGKILYKARIYEVSVEKNLFPPSFAKIKEELDKKEVLSFDHHTAGDLNPF